ALGACGEAPPAGGKLKIAPDTAQLRCVNQSSGAPWMIALDQPRGLADGKPATFGPRRVHWTSTGVSSDLDLASGVLTISRGSSTGGWVSTFTCAAVGQA
ncbi:MAG TPA: hypothetical protein VGG29_12325, partial [Caulobacteraceae bacterium]